jgi:hypothetical protein
LVSRKNVNNTNVHESAHKLLKSVSQLCMRETEASSAK